METNSQPGPRQTILQAACIASVVVAAVCVFWPALSFDFVSWGDPLHVSAPGLAPASVAGQTETTFAPVAAASLAIDRSLWGSHSTGFHLTSVLLHLVNASLVFLLIRRFTDNTVIAWATALMFAVHPVQVETVAWISARGTLLGTTAALTGLLLWLKDNRGRSATLGSTGCLVAAILANISFVVVPLILVAFDVLVQQKRTFDAVRESRINLFAAGLSGALCLVKSTAATALIDSSAVTVPEAFAMKVTALWRYLGMLVLPRDLCIAYSPVADTTSVAASFFAAVVGLTATVLCVLKLRKVRPRLAFAAATLGLLLLPAFSFSSYQASPLSDQFLYLPCVAFSCILASAVVGFGQLVERSLGRIAANTTNLVATCGLTGLLALAATDYLPVWNNSSTLWDHVATQLPEAVEVRIQQANALRYQGRETDALVALQNALKQFPRGTAAREQVDSLMKDWLLQSTERTLKRRSAHRTTLM